MLCDHLKPLEAELKQSGIKEAYRGQAWSHNCREWVYFDCHLDAIVGTLEPCSDRRHG